MTTKPEPQPVEPLSEDEIALACRHAAAGCDSLFCHVKAPRECPYDPQRDKRWLATIDAQAKEIAELRARPPLDVLVATFAIAAQVYPYLDVTVSRTEVDGVIADELNRQLGRTDAK